MIVSKFGGSSVASKEQFEKVRKIALVTGKTMGAVIRESSREHAKATVEDPEFQQKVDDLAKRLDRYSSSPTSRESK